jgi:hypothetical protein
MWSTYLSLAHVRAQVLQQNCIEDQEAAAGQNSSMAMNRYLTYVYLKRLGFVVTRPGTYGQVNIRREQTAPAGNQLPYRLSNNPRAWWPIFLNTLVTTLWGQASSTVSRVGVHLWEVFDLWRNPLNQPLVSNNDQLRYGEPLDDQCQ